MVADTRAIRRLARQGESIERIARQLGVSRYLVESTLDDAPAGRNYVPYRFRELQDTIVRRYRAGDAGEDIARDLGISTTAVYATLNRQQVVLRGKTKPHASSFEAELTADYLHDAVVVQGRSAADIAATIGCSESTVRNWMRRHRITAAPSPRRTTYAFPDELLDQIAAASVTIDHAAAAIGCSRSEALRALRRSGRNLPADRRPALTAAFLREHYVQRHMTTVAIADATGWHFNAVRAALRREQIPRRIGTPRREASGPVAPPAARSDRRSAR
jgi:DNA-binding CsgD family transcriptional regulator